MPLTLTWNDIALRLLLTVIAGLVIGFNRGEHGRPAGMRTTLLVCLAASLSMLQANLLMHSVGKSPDSFVVLDLMRLPLGVLSGMGFIGAGTILRKGNLIQGVTTAATLWFVTLMGLCFGGGQLGLGIIALILGWLTLWGLKFVELRMQHDMRGKLILLLAPDAPTDAQLKDQLLHAHCTILSWGIAYKHATHQRKIQCELQWRSRPGTTLLPPIIETLRDTPSIHSLRWHPESTFSSAASPQKS